MTDWREERNIARYTSDELFKDAIDSSLPNDIDSISDYMVDFYQESILTEEWMNTSDHVKKFMLDAQIDEYMQNIH